MARRDDLVGFAQLHGLKLGTIADLIFLSPEKRCLPGSGGR